MSHLDNPDYDGYETMGGYTDGEYNGGMAESSADYGGSITQGENQRYRDCGLYVFFQWSIIRVMFPWGLRNILLCRRVHRLFTILYSMLSL